MAVGVVKQLLGSGPLIVEDGVAQTELEASEQVDIVCYVPVAKLLVAEIDKMPGLVGGKGEIVSTFGDRVLVAAVEAGGIDEIECRGGGSLYRYCRIGGKHASFVGRDFQDGAEMYRMHLVASGMACDCQLVS